MRDAFGGSFMIMIFLVFIMIYICFTAVALNYAKAFKVKNTIIDYLEDNEITNICEMNAHELTTMENFFDTEIVGKHGYVSKYSKCKNDQYKFEDGECIGYCHSSGVDIDLEGNAENTEGVYYTVSTYVGWNIGFFSKLAALNGDREDPEVGDATGTWTISGQTRLIVNK